MTDRMVPEISLFLSEEITKIHRIDRKIRAEKNRIMPYEAWYII